MSYSGGWSVKAIGVYGKNSPELCIAVLEVCSSFDVIHQSQRGPGSG